VVALEVGREGVPLESSQWRYAIVAALVCVALFAAPLIAGHGLKSFVVLAAACVWIMKAHFDHERARTASPSRAAAAPSPANPGQTWNGPDRDD
jgi:hypothetical protein